MWVQKGKWVLMTRSEPAERIEAWRLRFESKLEQRIPAGGTVPSRLHEAMRYSALSGGKRIRPMLVYAAGETLDLPAKSLDEVACAIELIHAYSLIHDDLPAMDDDALRRGNPTCHLAFDEATAILAGDALQALAFLCLAEDTERPVHAVIEVIRLLASACGSGGMAGGQMLDLQATGNTLGIAELENIHALKTGALISASVLAPAIYASASATTFAALDQFSRCVGLGFQIRDDILDVTGEAEEIGKNPHADAERNKPTFPSLIGLEASRERASELRAEALKCLEAVEGETSTLAWLAHYMIERDR
jgi:farnesyl diphosphate synthase